MRYQTSGHLHVSGVVPVAAKLLRTVGSGLLFLPLPSLGCVPDQLTAPTATAEVIVLAHATGSTAGLVVDVSGPGINPAMLFNIAVGQDGVARETLSVPSGGGRRFVVTAIDTLGIATHRADTTVALAPGPNPGLALVLQPVVASVRVTITSQMRQLCESSP